ncbi:non-specific lipid transfer protein GPI-anchored 2 [Ricinus communis]|uniref:Lipid binding protein, putative n=1 Tax=Ricinus communis TaxID=3988 RepID=B9S6L0_RICCO|nr:non-specific lipid transfer protein GPI-anchored 2 [Ricinus communis]EEF40736.1 lipid binding protein, putative [Ricinus communis]|eukprot:XP_002521629.1 non-specific lipid transfer protein GPI-anchored 2 [Ricinus communis]
MHSLPSCPAAAIWAAIILSSTLCMVSAQAPASAPAPFSGMGPSVPEMPLGPSAPGPATNDCLTPLLNMSDCLSYVTESSNVTVPDKNCCPELAGLLDGNPICLCQLLGNSNLTESYGFKIDVNRALKLPSICRVSTPPVSLCSVAGYPVPGPIASEASPSPMDNQTPGVAPPEGLASSPSTGNNGNGASGVAGSAQAFFVGLAFSFLLTFF